MKDTKGKKKINPYHRADPSAWLGLYVSEQERDIHIHTITSIGTTFSLTDSRQASVPLSRYKKSVLNCHTQLTKTCAASHM